ncbi:MAG: hypothetical protein HXX17_01150 [Geobacteraceae bacterium]|nr:hypothetical protein [Geobacteraceae bacterium]
MRICVYLFIAVVIFISGCSNSNEKSIIGTWQELNNPLGKLEFNKDHSGIAYWPNEVGVQESSVMKWKVLKKENMVSVITPPGPVNFTIKQDRLISPNGVVLIKVKEKP